MSITGQHYMAVAWRRHLVRVRVRVRDRVRVWVWVSGTERGEPAFHFLDQAGGLVADDHGQLQRCGGDQEERHLARARGRVRGRGRGRGWIAMRAQLVRVRGKG